MPLEDWNLEAAEEAGYARAMTKEENKKPHTPIWYTCCHWCNRGTSIAGKIGNDGLCSFCRKKGRIANI